MSLSSSNPDPIALSFYDSMLRMSDVALLQGPHWLNDQIISFYFEYLGKIKFKTNNDILFVSPEVTQCLKFANSNEEMSIFLSPLGAERKPFIFFALNDNESTTAGGCHWSLLVFSRPENMFFHYDSFGASNFEHCQQIYKKIKNAINRPNANLKSMRCLQQNNSYDCGIHVLCMVDYLADYVNRFECIIGSGQIHHDTVSRKRIDILKIIQSLNGKVS